MGTRKGETASSQSLDHLLFHAATRVSTNEERILATLEIPCHGKNRA